MVIKAVLALHTPWRGYIKQKYVYFLLSSKERSVEREAKDAGLMWVQLKGVIRTLHTQGVHRTKCVNMCSFACYCHISTEWHLQAVLPGCTSGLHFLELAAAYGYDGHKKSMPLLRHTCFKFACEWFLHKILYCLRFLYLALKSYPWCVLQFYDLVHELCIHARILFFGVARGIAIKIPHLHLPLLSMTDTIVIST